MNTKLALIKVDDQFTLGQINETKGVMKRMRIAFLEEIAIISKNTKVIQGIMDRPADGVLEEDNLVWYLSEEDRHAILSNMTDEYLKEEHERRKNKKMIEESDYDDYDMLDAIY